MDFNQYQQQATKSATYPELGNNLVYPALGLAGEVGEVVEKVKKLWRNKGIKDGIEVDLEDRTEILLELGDVLWYVAALCNELGNSMDVVAEMNLDKLADRLQRGVIKSSGDNR